MSKVLKVIVHFIVICTILCILALALPPFFGVTTEIRDDSEQVTNLSMGSVTYAIPVKSTEIVIGDAILVQKDDVAWRYNVASVDLTTGLGTAVNPSAPEEAPVNISIGEYMPKIVLTVPLMGYLMVATRSVEGLVILGLVVLFLIILYIIAELWKKAPQEELPEDTEPGYVKSKKELKLEEKRREQLLKEEEREIRAESKQSKKKQPKRTVRTGGFVDEIEDEEEYEEEETDRPEKTVQRATSEAHEVLKKEIAAATAEDAAPVHKKKHSDQTKQVTIHKKKVQIPETLEESDSPEGQIEIKRLAIPRLTAAQLMQKAKKAGDSPEVVRDEITKVTLLDYSDILAGDDEED